VNSSLIFFTGFTVDSNRKNAGFFNTRATLGAPPHFWVFLAGGSGDLMGCGTWSVFNLQKLVPRQ
jgi:hypothetical protein